MAGYMVLVVDDNHEVRRMVTASIKTLGAEVGVLDVPSAEEALFISSTQPLDLVVIDFRLPGMSGLEMVDRLRKRKPEAKIILVTGVEDVVTRQQISEAGADAFFFKPIEINAFLDAVKRCLWSPADSKSLSSTGKDQAASMSPTTAKPSRAPAVNVIKETAADTPQTTLAERLAELKHQLKAVSALLVNDAGQVLEEAGSAVDISTGSALLSALMHAFRASLQVSQAVAKGNSESLQYFAAPRQCIYVAPVGMNHALFVVTAGYFGPDKLGMIYHTIHLAVHDLQIILANDAAKQKELENLQAELPAEITVDQETLAGIENIFSRASKTGGTQEADGFWEAFAQKGEKGTQDGLRGKDVLSYDQARDLGLAPDENTGA
jgi:DNA-binding response OmpR family regulator